jgi:hypothetical protein
VPVNTPLSAPAYTEAIAHLNKGLAVLRTLPNTAEHRQRELDLQALLGPVLTAMTSDFEKTP